VAVARIFPLGFLQARLPLPTCFFPAEYIWFFSTFKVSIELPRDCPLSLVRAVLDLLLFLQAGRDEVLQADPLLVFQWDPPSTLDPLVFAFRPILILELPTPFSIHLKSSAWIVARLQRSSRIIFLSSLSVVRSMLISRASVPLPPSFLFQYRLLPPFVDVPIEFPPPLDTRFSAFFEPYVYHGF